MDKYLMLNNGNKIPRLGFGTWKAEKNDAKQSVIDAIEIGYKHIDTAWIYQNEQYVGEAIKESGAKRDELFVTTKLWNDSHTYNDAYKSLERSLDLLQMDYVDLYLIHWPYPKEADWEEKNQETWKALEEFLRDGKVKNIGVSNFHKEHLESLLKTATVKPVVNQIKIAPGVKQEQVVKDCLSMDIAIESYSPLDKGSLVDNHILDEIGKKYSKSGAQVAIRWNLQKGYIPLPKSITKSRIADNINVFDFELSEDDMQKIDSFENPDAVVPDPNTRFDL